MTAPATSATSASPTFPDPAFQTMVLLKALSREDAVELKTIRHINSRGPAEDRGTNVSGSRAPGGDRGQNFGCVEYHNGGSIVFHRMYGNWREHFIYWTVRRSNGQIYTHGFLEKPGNMVSKVLEYARRKKL